MVEKGAVRLPKILVLPSLTIQLSLSLTASRVVLPQDPSTDLHVEHPRGPVALPESVHGGALA